MKKKYSLVLLILFVSLFIYLFYRTEKTLVNELMMVFLSFDTFAEIRSSIARAIPLNEPMIFSLPGGLWVFCTTVLAKDHYIKIGNRQLQLVAVPVLFAVGLEFCQLTHITRGTFDLLDIGFYQVFWLLAYYGFQSRSPPQNIMTSFTLSGCFCLACFLSVYLAHVSQ